MQVAESSDRLIKEGGGLGARAILTLGVFIWSFVFDFKRAIDPNSGQTDPGGGALQYAFLAVALVAGISFCLMDKRWPPSKSLTTVAMIWLGGLAISVTLSALYMVTGLEEVMWLEGLKQSVPFVLTGLGFCVLQSAVRQGLSLARLFRMIAWAAPCSQLFRLVYAVVALHVPFDDLRWQAQASVVIYCGAYGLASFLFDDSVNLLGIGNFLVFIFTVLIGISRGYLVSAGLNFVIGLLVLAYLSRRKLHIHVESRLWQLAAAGVLSIAVLAIVIAVRPNTLAKWQKRISGEYKVYVASGQIEVSLDQRRAQIKGQVAKLKSNSALMLFGTGFGATYIPDPTNYVAYGPSYHMMYNQPVTGGADGGLIYYIFLGGVLYGGSMLAVVGLTCLVPFISIRRMAHARNKEDVFLAIVVAFFCIGMSVYSVNAFGLSERETALVFGLVGGAAYVLLDRSKTLTSALPVPQDRTLELV